MTHNLAPPLEADCPPRPLDGCCQYCRNYVSTTKLVMDHDHGTGKFRAWCCDSCNTQFSRRRRTERERTKVRGRPGYRKRNPDYLFQRSGSQNWWIKLRTPGKHIEKSLGTSDREQALILSLPMIAQHKTALLARRPRLEVQWTKEYEPGLHTGLNNERIYATESELHYLDETPVRIEPNGVLSRRLVGGGALSAKQEFGILDAPDDEPNRFGFFPPKKDDDDAILDTYLTHRNITGYARSEAETVWAKFKELTGNTALKDATRNDGRKLAQYYKDAGNKSATVIKKVSWLRAAVELAIDEGKMKFNAFRNVVPKGDDELRRKPLSDADMKACETNLGALSESDRLLFCFLAATGARLGEAFQVDGEATELGVRYVVIGSKTEASQRRLPLPAGLLTVLPEKIVGRLFTGDARAASTRLNRFLNECGLTDRSLVVHSLRHRMKDKLRAVGCPLDVQYELLGHGKKTVAAGYGVGSPIPLLKEWIDKAGL
jgi:integrase